MTRQLHISKDLSLPLEFATKTVAILAQRRKGKTYTASVIAEEMVAAPAQGDGTSTPTGTAGQATQTCKVYADQAAKDAGANPLVIASEAWSVVPGGASKIGDVKFTFTPAKPPAPTP